MKSILLILAFFGPTIFSESTYRTSNFVAVAQGSNLENGWYSAKVDYFNNVTYKRNTYTLDVKVEWNSITTIDFGNGGTVHSGYNNSGYYYTGGYLLLNKDYEGNINFATTRVTITEDNGTIRNFDIEIN